MKSVTGKRKERLSTKHIILNGKFIVSTEEIHKQLAEAERNTKQKKSKRGHRQNNKAIKDVEMPEDYTSNELDMEQAEILDFIEVELVE